MCYYMLISTHPYLTYQMYATPCIVKVAVSNGKVIKAMSIVCLKFHKAYLWPGGDIGTIRKSKAININIACLTSNWLWWII